MLPENNLLTNVMKTFNDHYFIPCKYICHHFRTIIINFTFISLLYTCKGQVLLVSILLIDFNQ